MKKLMLTLLILLSTASGKVLADFVSVGNYLYDDEALQYLAQALISYSIAENEYYNSVTIERLRTKHPTYPEKDIKELYDSYKKRVIKYNKLDSKERLEQIHAVKAKEFLFLLMQKIEPSTRKKLWEVFTFVGTERISGWSIERAYYTNNHSPPSSFSTYHLPCQISDAINNYSKYDSATKEKLFYWIKATYQGDWDAESNHCKPHIYD